jgi:predicted transcriptional regulator
MIDTENRLNLIPIDSLNDAAACLKIMAHPVRLRIVDILMQGEYAVHEIAEMCGVKQHQVCEHLRLMQACGFLSSKRNGRIVYYSIISGKLPSLIHCIKSNCSVKDSEGV